MAKSERSKRKRKRKNKRKLGPYEFGTVGGREVRAGFDGEDVTSYGGVLPFFKFANKIGLFEEIAKIFPDFRNPNMVTYTTEDLIRQIAYGDLVGKHDFADHENLKHDPLMPVVLSKTGKSKEGRKVVVAAGKDTPQRLVDGTAKHPDAEEIHEKANRDINK